MYVSRYIIQLYILQHDKQYIITVENYRWIDILYFHSGDMI